MVVELINTGNELMLGRVLNTHQQWLCRRLADLGYVVSRQVAIGDTAEEITSAIREALSRADIIIATGGLGPTSDDMTRDAIAQLLKRKLHEDAEVLARIKGFFKSVNRPMPERTRVQALIPEGAIILKNEHGTAPGLALKVPAGTIDAQTDPSWLIMLPGPPRELRPMFNASVATLLRQEYPLNTPFVCRTIRTTGLGESLVEEMIAELVRPLSARGLTVGYCARPGEVDVRLCAQNQNADALVGEAEKLVRKRLGDFVFGEGDAELASVVIACLTERNQTLAVAESCTGGFIDRKSVV